MAETRTQTKIDQNAGAAGVTVICAAVAGKIARLRLLIGTIEAAGTVRIETTDGADLSGPMEFTEAGGLVHIASGRDINIDKELCIAGAAGLGLQINTSQKFNGISICTQD
ncbi:MAG: hypothetical protein GY832_01410 [Chloroflexi bacterium]|nr:hypothetical protein [Chloroflexota bacterium]